MRMQKDMVESFQMTHRNFMKNLSQSLDMLEHDIDEAIDVDKTGNVIWTKEMEESLDELAKYVYSISEPRWVSEEDSKFLHSMRDRLHDLYAKYKGARSSMTH